jgi:salicylate hydroxylase
MTLKAMNIAVIGGGIGGLTAAIALRQKGASVTLFEQAKAIGEVGAGIQISTNAASVLHALGLKPMNWPHSKPQAVELRDYKHGLLVSHIPMNISDEAPFIQFHRADLIEGLYQAAHDAGVVIKLGCRTQLESTTPNGVEIDSITYDLVVGADGVRSTLRDQFYDGKSPEFTGKIAWRTLVQTDNLPNGFQPNTCIYMGPKKHIVTYPLRNGKLINIVAVEERNEWADEGWNHQGNANDLCQMFKGWCPDIETLLAQAQSPNVWGLFAHAPLQDWMKGRIVLLGDSAHPMVPFIAQGACMAIEDAWVLADQLAKEPEVTKALSQYQDIRKPRTTKVQQTALQSGNIYHASNPLTRKVLHMGMKLCSKAAPSIMSRHYDWIYTHDVTKN